MNYTVNIRMFLEDLVEGRFIGDIELVEGGLLAANKLDAIK